MSEMDERAAAAGEDAVQQSGKRRVIPDPVAALRLSDAGDLLLSRVLCALADCSDLRQLQAASATLKNLKDVQQVCSPLDEEERQLRLEKLRRELRRDELSAAPVEVRFAGDAEAAAK